MTQRRMMKAALLAGGLLALTTLMAQPAFAGDATCVWGKAPEARRDAFLADYHYGKSAVGDLWDSQDDTRAALKACGEVNDSAIRAMVGYATRQGVAVQLKRDYGVNEDDIVAAWLTVPPADRATFAADGVDLEKTVSDFDQSVVIKVNAVLKVSDNDARALVFAYLLAMVVQADAEPKF